MSSQTQIYTNTCSNIKWGCLSNEDTSARPSVTHFHPLKRGHLSNEDTFARSQANRDQTYHPLKRGHLSNEDTSARSQANKDQTYHPPKREDTSLIRTSSLVPVASLLYEAPLCPFLTSSEMPYLAHIKLSCLAEFGFKGEVWQDYQPVHV